MQNESLSETLPEGAQDRRIRILLTLTAVILLAQYVETMVLPGVPIIRKNFGITATVAS